MQFRYNFLPVFCTPNIFKASCSNLFVLLFTHLEKDVLFAFRASIYYYYTVLYYIYVFLYVSGSNE